MKATYEEIIRGTAPVLVDFHATWCGPCKTMAPVLDALKSELGEGIRIVKIDVDKNTDLAVRQKVMGVPTFILYKNGEEVWRDAGVQTKESLKNIILNGAQ